VLSAFLNIFSITTINAQFRITNKELIKMIDSYLDMQVVYRTNPRVIMLIVLNAHIDNSLLKFDSLEIKHLDEGLFGSPLIVLNPWEKAYSLMEMPPQAIMKHRAFDVFIYIHNGGLFDYTIELNNLKKLDNKIKKQFVGRNRHDTSWSLMEDPNGYLLIQQMTAPMLFNFMYKED